MKTTISILFFLLLPLALLAQFDKDVERYLTEVNDIRQVPGSAVAILRGDKVIYEGCFGP